MSKKWIIPLLLALPFLPVLLWGFHLPEPSYAALSAARRAADSTGSLADFSTAFDELTTPLFPLGVAFLARLGLPPGPVAILLGTLGWGVAAWLIQRCGARLGYPKGSTVAAVLFALNPWIIPSLGEATGWIIALAWLIANFALARRYVAATLAALFLLSLFFHPSQGFSWPLAALPPLLWSAVLLAAALGIERLTRYAAERGVIAQEGDRAAAMLLAVLFLVGGTWQATRTWQLFNMRPLAQWALEEQAATWLRDNSGAANTLLSSERIGFLAERDVEGSTPADLQAIFETDPPDFVVSGSTLPWQMLEEALWFRLAYEPVLRLGEPASTQTPLTIWAYRPAFPDLGPRQGLNARVPDRLTLLGYQLGTQLLDTERPLDMALFLQAPAATLAEPAPFQAMVRLAAALDGRTVVEWNVDLPQSVTAEAWQPSQVISERFELPLPPDLEAGAYLLNLSLAGLGETELWPISFNNDVNRLDRVPLNYVNVPWRGDLSAATPANVDFGQGIRLTGFELGEARPGDPLAATLYWQADSPVGDALVVFVHLLDNNGQLIANHDGPPANGRFPTQAWQPGMTIPDTHSIPLPADLPPGQYELRAGLYYPETGTRLPLEFMDGAPADGDAVSLGSVTIGE